MIKGAKFANCNKINGIKQISIPDIKVTKTDILCFTGFISLSKFNIGRHRFINNPKIAKNILNTKGKENNNINWKKLNEYKNVKIIVEKISGIVVIVRWVDIFEKNIVFSLIGVDFKIQIFLPSREIELAEIVVSANNKEMITARVPAIISKEFFKLFRPNKSPKKGISKIIIGPIIVFIKYIGVLK